MRGPGQEQEEQEVVGRGEETCREEGCWVTEALADLVEDGDVGVTEAERREDNT